MNKGLESMLDQPMAGVAKPTSADAEGITALFDRLMRALNDHNAALMNDVFTADLMLSDAFGRRLNSWGDADAVFGTLFATEVPSWTMSCTVLRILLIDRNVAIVNTMHQLAVGSGISVSNVTSVAVRRRERWWIAASHSGPFTPIT